MTKSIHFPLRKMASKQDYFVFYEFQFTSHGDFYGLLWEYDIFYA